VAEQNPPRPGAQLAVDTPGKSSQVIDHAGDYPVAFLATGKAKAPVIKSIDLPAPAYKVARDVLVATGMLAQAMYEDNSPDRRALGLPGAKM
jgi:hypothetical protein